MAKKLFIKKKFEIKDKKKRVELTRGRIWIGTWNNPPINPKKALEDLHNKLDASYTHGQLEKGEKEGTLHIQFVVHLKSPKRLIALKKTNERIHWELTRSKAAEAYVDKTETRVEGPWYFGNRPVKRNSKIDWEYVWNLAKKNEIESIPPSIRVNHYNKLKLIAKEYMEPEDADHLRGIWIYGEAGVGKSRKVRELVPKKDLYAKLCNKWWDGYKGQKVVVMDDFGPDQKCLAQQLKIWSDRYGCVLEIKGGATYSSYDWFIITSQYSLEEIFDKDEDERTRDALERRFRIYHYDQIDEFEEWFRSVYPKKTNQNISNDEESNEENKSYNEKSISINSENSEENSQNNSKNDT